MSRIGVFVCHCGHNIAGTVDVKTVVEQLQRNGDVVFAIDYKYMCSDPGQQLIRESIEKYQLDGVVVAACSPAMHESTFRRTVSAAGLNGFRCESANIREQVSWVHQQDKEAATQKAIEITESIVEKVKRNEALEPLILPLTHRTLVIGGGIAGMQAALDVAEAGYPVILVERQDHLGGRMAELSGSYLNFQAAPDLLEKKVQQVLSHPGIQTLLNAEVEGLSGYVGNFRVRVRQKPSDAQAPLVPLDDLQPLTYTFDVGAIVVASGWQPYDRARLPEYGGADIPDVVDGLTFERMLRSGDVIRRPSDGKIAREVVFVQCAGSRDPEHGVSYCSKVCCMYVAKQAMLYKERVPQGQAYVFYIDIRSAGKNYDEYVQRAMTDYGVLYLRGKVSRVFREGDQTIVWGSDTLTGRAVEIAADLVVLATGVVANDGAQELAQTIGISYDTYNFLNEAHPKLRPVETNTDGIYLAGMVAGPKDIPDTVSQASAAAVKVCGLFSKDALTTDAMTSYVNAAMCVGCLLCKEVCPFNAIETEVTRDKRTVAKVNEGVCKGCGVCVAACRGKAITLRGFSDEQLLEEVAALKW